MIRIPHLVPIVSALFLAKAISVADETPDGNKKELTWDAGPLSWLDPHTAVSREEFDKIVSTTRKAADGGDAKAQALLSGFLRYGRPGVPKDEAKADALATQAEKHIDDLSVLTTLALSFRKYNGDVPDKYVEQAVKLARQGAKRGDPVCENLMGLYAAEGLQKKCDKVEALKWFLLSAHHGLAAGNRNAQIIANIMTREEVLSAKSKAGEILAERARPAGSTPRPYPEVIFKQRPKSEPDNK